MTTPLILIADDDPMIVALLSHHLIAAGLGVVTATNGRAAVEAARRHRPDIAILDVDMPDLSGVQALRVMRTRRKPPPTIMLTARRRPNDIVEGVMAGAKVYLTKPFDPDDVILRVQSLLSPEHDGAMQAERSAA